MELFIHAGMNKTGSSSIQATLNGRRFGTTRYLDWRSPNHSGLFALLFHEPVEAYHSFKLKGFSREALLAQRREAFEQLDAELASGETGRLIFSGESVSAHYPDAVFRMADHLATRGVDVRILAYVRPPVSFMQSAFQQRVRSGGMKTLRPKGLWPAYRARFEKLDQAFGRERVTLKPFLRDRLTGGDVVLDLLAELGVTLDPAEIVRTNESASLESIAMIFAQRHFGSGLSMGFPGSHRSNERFIKALGRIGTQKLAFSPALTDPVMAENRDDLEWMEERLGTPLADAPSPSDRPIATEADLLAVAEEACDTLEPLLLEAMRADAPGDHGRLTRNLEVLRALFVWKSGG